MRRNNQKMHGLSAWCLDLSTSWCVHVCVCVCVCVAQGLKSLSKGKMTICFHFLCEKLLWSDLLLELESKKIQAWRNTSKHYTTSYNHNHIYIYIYHYYHCLTSTVTARSPNRSKPGFLTSTKSSLREANAQPAQEHEPQKLADRLKLLWKDDATKGAKVLLQEFSKLGREALMRVEPKLEWPSFLAQLGLYWSPLQSWATILARDMLTMKYIGMQKVHLCLCVSYSWRGHYAVWYA